MIYIKLSTGKISREYISILIIDFTYVLYVYIYFFDMHTCLRNAYAVFFSKNTDLPDTIAIYIYTQLTHLMHMEGLWVGSIISHFPLGA